MNYSVINLNQEQNNLEQTEKLFEFSDTQKYKLLNNY